MPQDRMQGAAKPPSKKKQGLLARLRARARSTRHPAPAVVSKEQGKQTGSAFKSAAQNRGAALRELTGAATTPAESAKVAKRY